MISAVYLDIVVTNVMVNLEGIGGTKRGGGKYLCDIFAQKRSTLAVHPLLFFVVLGNAVVVMMTVRRARRVTRKRVRKMTRRRAGIPTSTTVT